MAKAHLMHLAMRKVPGIWIHVCRDGDTYPELLDEVDDLDGIVEKAFFFTNPSPGDARGGKYRYSGRPSLDVLRESIAKPYETNPLNITPIEIPGTQSTFYMCGPETFEKDMKAHLRALGVGEGSIHSENFSGAVVEAPKLKGGRLVFAKSKKTTQWDSETQPGLSILEIAERVGLTPEYVCLPSRLVGRFPVQNCRCRCCQEMNAKRRRLDMGRLRTQPLQYHPPSRNAALGSSRRDGNSFDVKDPSISSFEFDGRNHRTRRFTTLLAQIVYDPFSAYLGRQKPLVCTNHVIPERVPVDRLRLVENETSIDFDTIVKIGPETSNANRTQRNATPTEAISRSLLSIDAKNPLLQTLFVFA